MYHIRQQWNLLPVCGACQHWYFELAQSLDCRSNLYQRTHVKSVPADVNRVWDTAYQHWYSVCHTERRWDFITFTGRAKSLISVSSSPVTTLTVRAGFFKVAFVPWLQQQLIGKKKQKKTPTYHGYLRGFGKRFFLQIKLKFQLTSTVWIVNRMRN